jgi:hypothetical protein
MTEQCDSDMQIPSNCFLLFAFRLLLSPMEIIENAMMPHLHAVALIFLNSFEMESHLNSATISF